MKSFRTLKNSIVLASLITGSLSSPTFAFSKSNSDPSENGLTQIEAFNDDFDDNVFVTDAKIMVWNTATHQEFGFSTAEWALVKGLIGQKGPFENFVLRDDAFRYFGDTTALGDDLFKVLIEKALNDHKGHEEEEIEGPSWTSWTEALGSSKKRAYTSIITAELHSSSAFQKGLNVLYERGRIPSLPDLNNIYVVGAPDFPAPLRGNDSAESKANVMKLILDKIEGQPIPADATPVENREGTGRQKLHLWGFSDDDFGNFSTAINTLAPEVAKGRWPHIKIVLFYTGLNNPEQRPHAVVIRSNGKTRSTTINEATRAQVLTRLRTSEQAKADFDDLVERANARKGKILVVLSSESQLVLKNGKTYPVGFYLNEMGIPAQALVQAGYELVFANPKGNAPALDESSDNVKYFNDPYTYLQTKDFYQSLDKLRHPKKLVDVLSENMDQYAGMFIPGGHAPMTDLMMNKDLGQILRYFHEANKPTAVICHGPCALVSTVSDPVAYREALIHGDLTKAQELANDWIYKDYHITTFSSTEDILAEPKLGGPVPFFPETVLQTAGAVVEVGPQRQSHTKAYRELFSGQNPQSDQELCRLLLQALRKH